MARFRVTLSAACAAAAIACTGPAAAGAAVCPPQPSTVAPGKGPGAFTMLFRINQQANIDAFKNSDPVTGLGSRLRPQDIFVINTRFSQTTPAVAEQLAAELRANFPCNRIIALNGISPDTTQPGYAFSLANSPAGIWSVMFDFEPMDWNQARFYLPGLPPWSYHFKSALRRYAGLARNLSRTLAGTANPWARGGIAPLLKADWDYGEFARKTDRFNRRLGGRHTGTQSVQTQDTCRSGSRSFGRQLKTIRRQYGTRGVVRKKFVMRHGKRVRKRFIKRKKLKRNKRADTRNLVGQISFSDTPSPGDPLPIRAVGPAQADNCVAAGMQRGQRAFFFFASDASLRLLFAQPTIASLRPA